MKPTMETTELHKETDCDVEQFTSFSEKAEKFRFSSCVRFRLYGREVNVACLVCCL